MIWCCDRFDTIRLKLSDDNRVFPNSELPFTCEGRYRSTRFSNNKMAVIKIGESLLFKLKGFNLKGDWKDYKDSNYLFTTALWCSQNMTAVRICSWLEGSSYVDQSLISDSWNVSSLIYYTIKIITIEIRNWCQ